MLRRLIHLRHLSSPPPLKPHFSPLSKPLLHQHHHPTSLLLLRSFSSSPQNNDEIALSLSSELLKPTTTTNLPPLFQRLDLSFSHVTLSPQLILSTLHHSPHAGRSALDFFHWITSKTPLTDETLSFFVHFFGRRKDFKVILDIITEVNTKEKLVGPKTFAALIDRLVRAGRPTQAVSFFEKMETDYGIAKDRHSLNYIVTKLCDHGHANYAEKLVKNVANDFFPDEYVCDMLIKGWCNGGKLEEARRLAREMYRGGFELGTMAYNAILDCVCKLCRKKDVLRLMSEAESVLVDMDTAAVPRNTETFNVLLTNLCKLRKTEEAVKLFGRMGEWGCYPDATTFVVMTRSLYQAARVGEGDEMMDRMRSAGFGESLDKKVYFGYLRILCGIERIDHALSVFDRMKADGCKPGVKSYELLIRKLYEHGRGERANALFNEAVRNGVEIEHKVYTMDPRFEEKKPKVVKKGKKRLTLPQKMALKRKTLKKINLSYVKKPRKLMQRMY